MPAPTNRIPLHALLGVLFALGVNPPQRAQADDAADKVRTAIVDKCLACHAGEKAKGGLDLTRRAGLLKGGESGPGHVSGKPEESVLLEKLASGEMPPKNPLAPELLDAFRAWVAADAPYAVEPLVPRRAGQDWWSLQPIQRPPVPTVPPVAGPVRNPIDAFVIEQLQAHGLAIAPEADRPTLIRRLSFDLNGLPPTPEEVDAFVADPRVDAYERLVDRLLASPRYGERWGRHWLDVVRFGESHGYEMNQPRYNAWPYRDYVIAAFNADTPFPRFVLEQLAGDTLTNADPLTASATGFLVGGSHDQVGNATLAGMLQQRADDLDDMITATGSAFLGLTLQCARCHDHKFDPITQRDYYGLAAVFAGVRHADRDLPVNDTPARRAELARVVAELGQVERQIDDAEPPARPESDAATRGPVRVTRNVERFAPISARGVRFTVLATNNESEPCLDELEAWTAGPGPRNVALATAGGVASASSEYAGSDLHRIVHLNDGRVGNSRSWISASRGKGRAEVRWVLPATIDRVVWGRDREAKFNDRLAVDYYVEVELAEAPGRWVVVASSSDRVRGSGMEVSSPNIPQALRTRQAALRARIDELGTTRKVYAGSFTSPDPTFVLRRGDPMQKGAAVSPSAPAVVGRSLALPADASEPDRRRAFAEWLGDPSNPLPARVMVNRAWHYHFGRGFVVTPGDFGFNGGTPTHPALLDWLASAYRDHGYHLKPIQRLIVTSATYRQAGEAESKVAERGRATDRGNVWLWHYPARRLEAEPIRDAVLFVSGQLDPTMGGPGYSVWEKNTNYVMVYNPKDVLGPAEFRRMVYQFKPRSRQDPVFGVFDCPDAALVAPRRGISTTPLQALNLLNSRFLVDQSEALAERLKREAGSELSAQVDRAFRLAFGRMPIPGEREAGVALARQHGLPALGRALFNANEFVYLP